MSKLEIERKFLVDRNKWKREIPTCVNKRHITQVYLAQDAGWEVRGRISSRQKMSGVLRTAEITVKSPKHGAGRYELNMEVDAMWLLAQPVINSIVKTRREFLFDGFMWEVDEFHGANEGLVVAEVELKEGTTFGDLKLPPFCYTEVTDDERYRNASLATTPWTQWTEE